MTRVVKAARPVVQTTGFLTPGRAFSLVIPYRLEGEDMPPSKPCGYLAERGPFARREQPKYNTHKEMRETETFKMLRVRMDEQRRQLDDLEKFLYDFARADSTSY